MKAKLTTVLFITCSLKSVGVGRHSRRFHYLSFSPPVPTALAKDSLFPVEALKCHPPQRNSHRTWVLIPVFFAFQNALKRSIFSVCHTYTHVYFFAVFLYTHKCICCTNIASKARQSSILVIGRKSQEKKKKRSLNIFTPESGRKKERTLWAREGPSSWQMETAKLIFVVTLSKLVRK